VPLINDDGVVNTQEQTALRDAKKKKWKNIFGHVLMNEYVFFMTALFTVGWSYGFFVLGDSEGDFFTLSIWMSLQIFKFVYFLRTKYPNTCIGNCLNQWAFDVGAEPQNMNPSLIFMDLERTITLESWKMKMMASYQVEDYIISTEKMTCIGNSRFQIETATVMKVTEVRTNGDIVVDRYDWDLQHIIKREQFPQIDIYKPFLVARKNLEIAHSNNEELEHHLIETQKSLNNAVENLQGRQLALVETESEVQELSQRIERLNTEKGRVDHDIQGAKKKVSSLRNKLGGKIDHDLRGAEKKVSSLRNWLGKDTYSSSYNEKESVWNGTEKLQRIESLNTEKGRVDHDLRDVEKHVSSLFSSQLGKDTYSSAYNEKESIWIGTENLYSSYDEVSNAVKELGLFNGEYWIGTDQEILSAAERNLEICKKLIETVKFNSIVVANDCFPSYVAKLLKEHEEYTREIENDF
jgi:uncharacterized protein (UPF0335 family)